MGIKYQAPALASGFFVALCFVKAMQQLAVPSCYIEKTVLNFENTFSLVQNL